MMLLTLSAAALMTQTAPLAAQDQPSPTPQEAAQPVARPDEADAQHSPAKPAAEARKITDRKHPDYVRCKRESVIGSRAKSKRTCMTNREWALVERRGNEQSAEFMGDNFAAGLY
ncbi:MAG: hypothetical protein AAF291_16075 [Pseudomonadota bacterium]